LRWSDEEAEHRDMDDLDSERDTPHYDAEEEPGDSDVEMAQPEAYD